MGSKDRGGKKWERENMEGRVERSEVQAVYSERGKGEEMLFKENNKGGKTEDGGTGERREWREFAQRDENEVRG